MKKRLHIFPILANFMTHDIWYFVQVCTKLLICTNYSKSMVTNGLFKNGVTLKGKKGNFYSVTQFLIALIWDHMLYSLTVALWPNIIQ